MARRISKKISYERRQEQKDQGCDAQPPISTQRRQRQKGYQKSKGILDHGRGAAGFEDWNSPLDS
jgi:hypothetical protein